MSALGSQQKMDLISASSLPHCGLKRQNRTKTILSRTMQNNLYSGKAETGSRQSMYGYIVRCSRLTCIYTADLNREMFPVHLQHSPQAGMLRITATSLYSDQAIHTKRTAFIRHSKTRRRRKHQMESARAVKSTHSNLSCTPLSLVVKSTQSSLSCTPLSLVVKSTQSSLSCTPLSSVQIVWFLFPKATANIGTQTVSATPPPPTPQWDTDYDYPPPPRWNTDYDCPPTPPHSTLRHRLYSPTPTPHPSLRHIVAPILVLSPQSPP